MPGYTLLAGVNRVASDESFAPRGNNAPIYQPQNGLQYSGPQHVQQQQMPPPMMYGAPHGGSFPSAPQQFYPNDQQLFYKSAPATPLMTAPIQITPVTAPYDRV